MSGSRVIKRLQEAVGDENASVSSLTDPAAMRSSSQPLPDVSLVSFWALGAAGPVAGAAEGTALGTGAGVAPLTEGAGAATEVASPP